MLYFCSHILFAVFVSFKHDIVVHNFPSHTFIVHTQEKKLEWVREKKKEGRNRYEGIYEEKSPSLWTKYLTGIHYAADPSLQPSTLRVTQDDTTITEASSVYNHK